MSFGGPTQTLVKHLDPGTLVKHLDPGAFSELSSPAPLPPQPASEKESYQPESC